MEITLNTQVEGNRKALIFNDNSPVVNSSGVPQGWGIDLDFANYNESSNPTIYAVTAEISFKTYSETYTLSANLCELGIFGTALVPITAQSEIIFYLILNLDGELEIVTADTYDADLAQTFPDGICDLTYEIIDATASQGTYDANFVVTESAEYLLEQKVINLDLKFFTDKYDAKDLLDVLVLDGLLFMTEKSSNFAKEDVILKCLNTINNQEHEYYTD